MSRMYDITRLEVDAAWKQVRQAGGSAGADGKTIQDVESNLNDELYKIWNRLSSGSYQAQPVKEVLIPKAKGGFRPLGIPTVTDRVAQAVIKNRLAKALEGVFHPNSYAYQANKSAVDAVLQARERCMLFNWAVEIDIKGFFDNVDHDLMLEILSKYTTDKSILLYSKKFLKASKVTEDGEVLARDIGTPQGGVISPDLANLFLHEALDKWMKEVYPDIPFERYADDIVIHCQSESDANKLKIAIEERLRLYKLTLHPEKTRIVYTGTGNDHDDRGHKMPRKFSFLGYDFKPRWYKGKIVFTPGMGHGALKLIGQKLKKLRIGSMVHGTLEELAKKLNPKILGWINYYGHARRSELYKMANIVNRRLIKWLSKKYKIKFYGKKWDMLKKLKQENPTLFAHWHMIAQRP